MDTNRLHYLLGGFFNQRLTPEEKDELFVHIHQFGDDEAMLAAMEDCWNEFEPKENISAERAEDILYKVSGGQAGREVEAVPVRRERPFIRWLSAAAVLVLAIGASWWFFQPEGENAKVSGAGTVIPTPGDVHPGMNKATLQLANGRIIGLGDSANETLAREGNMKILSLEGGKLLYEAEHTKEGENEEAVPVFNTLATPKGGQYQLNLPDGTRVWLNAGSSIRYPTFFRGDERTVSITGEVYFEVAPLPLSKGSLTATSSGTQEEKKMPFIVRFSTPSGAAGEVEVLGTHFNINAYADEPGIYTTLLEGSVKIKTGSQARVLVPGQQARIPNGHLSAASREIYPASGKAGDGSIEVVTLENRERFIAWKEGLFDFDQDPVPDIMRQLARWYDVDVLYKGPVPDGHYMGSIRRQVNISEVLKMLELTGGIRFSIEGRKIIIMKQEI